MKLCWQFFYSEKSLLWLKCHYHDLVLVKVKGTGSLINNHQQHQLLTATICRSKCKLLPTRSVLDIQNCFRSTWSSEMWVSPTLTRAPPGARSWCCPDSSGVQSQRELEPTPAPAWSYGCRGWHNNTRAWNVRINKYTASLFNSQIKIG